MNEFLKFRNKYNNFIYDKYDISYDEENMIIKFFFSIEGLEEFTPSIKINKKYIKNKNINKNMLNYLVFHIGIIEMIRVGFGIII